MPWTRRNKNPQLNCQMKDLKQKKGVKKLERETIQENLEKETNFK